MDLSSDQTITGIKTFKDEIDLQYPNGNTTWKIKAAGDYSFFIQRDDNIWFNLITTQGLGLDYTFYPINSGKDLGKSASPWNDLYLSGGVKIGSGNIWYNGSFYINDDFCSSNDTISLGKEIAKWKDLYLSGNVNLSSPNATYKLLADGAWFDIKRDNTTVFQFYDTIIKSPKDNYADLGVSGNRWKNLYLAGNLTDGTNTITVANIPSKQYVDDGLETKADITYVDNAIQQAITNVLTKEF